MFTLVGLDVRIHAAQLLLDHDQTVVDEVGGVHHDLVLVVDRVCVVDGDQRVDHIFRTGDGDVLERQVDDRGRLARQRGLQVCLETDRHVLQRRLRHLHGRVEILVAVVKRRDHHYSSDGCRDGVVQRHCHRFAGRLVVNHEVGQYHLFRRDRFCPQREGLRLFRIGE